MIKKISLILMISIIMTGCSNTQKESKESTFVEIKNEIESDEKKFENSIKSGTANMSEYKKINDARNFSDGVAWVYIDYEDLSSRWVCVEPSGKILFSLDNGIEPTSDFSNGIATLSDNTIIDKSGQIIASPELTGYDEIVIVNKNKGSDTKVVSDNSGSYEHNEIIKDGLVFVKKIEESYNGDKELVGIVNSKGEWALEPSKEFLNISYMNNNLFEVCVDEGDLEYKIFDTSSMKLLEIEDVLDKLYAEKYDLFEWNEFRNYESEELDLSRYPYIYVATPFYKGHSALVLGADNESKWVTVIDDSGNELFSPKKLDNSSLTHIDDGMYCVSQEFETQGETKYKRVFYDFKGNKLFEINTESTINIFSEGYAFVEPINTGDESEYGFFIDKNGNKLWSDS